MSIIVMKNEREQERKRARIVEEVGEKRGAGRREREAGEGVEKI